MKRIVISVCTLGVIGVLTVVALQGRGVDEPVIEQKADVEREQFEVKKDTPDRETPKDDHSDVSSEISAEVLQGRQEKRAAFGRAVIDAMEGGDLIQHIKFAEEGDADKLKQVVLASREMKKADDSRERQVLLAAGPEDMLTGDYMFLVSRGNVWDPVKLFVDVGSSDEKVVFEKTTWLRKLANLSDANWSSGEQQPVDWSNISDADMEKQILLIKNNLRLQSEAYKVSQDRALSISEEHNHFSKAEGRLERYNDMTNKEIRDQIVREQAQ